MTRFKTKAKAPVEVMDESKYLRFHADRIIETLANFDLNSPNSLESESVGIRARLSNDDYEYINDDFFVGIRNIMDSYGITVIEVNFSEPCIDCIISKKDLKIMQAGYRFEKENE